MHLRILGCSGSESPGFNTSSFLVDDSLAIDSGAICQALNDDEQNQIRHILITHTHLDHIKGVALLADNLSLAETGVYVEIISIRENLDLMQKHLFNDILWPNFTRLPSPETPTLAYRALLPLKADLFGAYTVTACPVHHTVPTVGYLVQQGGRSLLFSGDTGPTDRLWELANNVDALIVDVSFPNAQEELALGSGHLTTNLLEKELRKVKILPKRILVSHAKPKYLNTIKKELTDLGLPGIRLLRDGDSFEFD